MKGNVRSAFGNRCMPRKCPTARLRRRTPSSANRSAGRCSTSSPDGAASEASRAAAALRSSSEAPSASVRRHPTRVPSPTRPGGGGAPSRRDMRPPSAATLDQRRLSTRSRGPPASASRETPRSACAALRSSLIASLIRRRGDSKPCRCASPSLVASRMSDSRVTARRLPRPPSAREREDPSRPPRSAPRTIVEQISAPPDFSRTFALGNGARAPPSVRPAEPTSQLAVAGRSSRSSRAGPLASVRAAGRAGACARVGGARVGLPRRRPNSIPLARRYRPSRARRSPRRAPRSSGPPLHPRPLTTSPRLLASAASHRTLSFFAPAHRVAQGRVRRGAPRGIRIAEVRATSERSRVHLPAALARRVPFTACRRARRAPRERRARRLRRGLAAVRSRLLRLLPVVAHADRVRVPRPRRLR